MSGVVVGLAESSVPGVWHRWLEKEILWFCFRRAEPDIILSFSAGRCRQYLLLPEGFRRNERLRRVYRPRPLSVSRVKCGGGPCRGHSVLPCVGNTICLQYAFYKKLWRI